MSARTDFVEMLEAELPTFKIVPFGRSLDGIDRPTLMVKQDTVSPGPTIGSRTVQILVYVISQFEDPANAESDLEDSLDLVLDVLDQHTGVAYSTAERASLDEKFHCYQITLSVIAKIKEDQ